MITQSRKDTSRSLDQSQFVPLERSVKTLFVNLRSPEYPLITAPTGIVTLGGYLRHTFGERIDIQYIDLQIEDVQAVSHAIRLMEPDIVGLSIKVGGTDEMISLLEQLTRGNFKNSPIFILGNVVPTYASSEFLHSFPGVICCVGRGELTMRRLVEDRARNYGPIDMQRIPSCTYLYDGEIKETRGESFDLEELGIADWETLFQRYAPNLYQEIWIEASRGCPQKRGGVGCSFCAIMPNAGSRDWRSRPQSSVLDEIELISSFNVRHIRFADEEFMAGQTIAAYELATGLLNLRQKLGPKMPTFDFAIRVDDVFKRGPRSNRIWNQIIDNTPTALSDNDVRLDALITFKAAGLTQVYLGLESGSFNQLKRMYKAVGPLDNERALAVLRKIGLQVAAGWIMIDPLMDGLEDLKENIEFLKRNRLIPKSVLDDFVTNPISRMRALVGSPMIEQLRTMNLLGPRKSNLIEHEFKYKNPLIERISNLLDRWETATKPLVYAIKNIVAVEALGKEQTHELNYLSSFLFKLKALDFEFIDLLVREASDVEQNGLATETIDISGAFIGRRKKLIDDVIAEIRSGHVVLDHAGTLSDALDFMNNSHACGGVADIM